MTTPPRNTNSGRTLIFGATGQVGSALVRLLGPRAVALDYPEVDLSHPERLQELLDRLAPETVINAAAYTQVDRAEEEEELAIVINGTAPGAMARWCASRGVPFVHYSTDYVFNGEGSRPWNENDKPAPLNAYGRTKLEGERLVAAAGGKYLLIRACWIYDESGKNFLKTMLKLGMEQESLSIVDDQYGAPTYAPQFAKATLDALQSAAAQPNFPAGIYHLCHSGETTWNRFAAEIFAIARERGFPIKVKELKKEAPRRAATRPHNSRLNTAKIADVLGIRLPSWQNGLSECMSHLSWPNR